MKEQYKKVLDENKIGLKVQYQDKKGIVLYYFKASHDTLMENSVICHFPNSSSTTPANCYSTETGVEHPIGCQWLWARDVIFSTPKGNFIR